MSADLLTDVARTRARVRAARGSGSIPFIVLGATTIPLGLPEFFGASTDVVALAPTVAFLAVLTAVWCRGQNKGVGVGSDGYVFLAVTGALMLLAIPVTMVVGPATILGGGLALLGIRGRDVEMSSAGFALGVVGWLAMSPAVGFADLVDALMLAAVGGLLVIFGVIRLRSEQQILAR